MKKLLIILTFSFIGSAAFTQGFGIRLGANLAKQKYDFADIDRSKFETISLFGLQFGIDYEFGFTESLYFNPAILYSSKGTKLKITFFEETLEGTTQMNFIDIPLDFVYKMDVGDMKVGLFAGPYLGYFLNGTSSIEEEKVDIEKDDVNVLDYGLDFGVGLYVGHLNFRISYELGLADIGKKEESYNNDGTIKNRVLSFTAGYRF